jgi:hypothetical protein
MTVKVRDVIAKLVLSPELKAMHLPVAKLAP